MALKVMLSSVRRGLADVRDAVAPVLKILRYEVIRFETVVKTPSPPRATCVEMVESADIYLLILGEEYGDPMPGTDLAPTEEEWRVARGIGRPIVVFKQAGIRPTGRQADFIKRVEDYETGAWRHSFADTGDLLAQLEGALSAAAESLQPVSAGPLVAPLAVPWLEARVSGIGSGGTVLETHVMPAQPTRPIPAAALPDLRRTIANAGQDHDAFEVGQALDFDVNETGVTARTGYDRGRPVGGIRVSLDRIVSVWQALPSASMLGVVLDEGQFAHRVARDLRIAAAIRVIDVDRVGIGIGFNDVSMLGVPAEFGTGMTLPFAMRGKREVRVEPSDSWPMKVLTVGADDISRELVARLMLKLGRP